MKSIEINSDFKAYFYIQGERRIYDILTHFAKDDIKVKVKNVGEERVKITVIVWAENVGKVYSIYSLYK
jgi:hypothetical protein